MGKLTAIAVARAAEPGMYSDGQGLYLQVTHAGAKSWIYRYQLHGKPHYLGLGSASAITLKRARELLAEDARQYQPGSAAISGEYRGRDAILAFYARLASETNGTFRVVLEGVYTDGAVGLFLLATDADGVGIRPVETTTRIPHADVFLDGATVSAADLLQGPGTLVRALYTRALVGLCAIQLGVSDRALRMAAEYTTGREQFGRPIGSFQAVQQRMADGFIDVEAIRWTTWHAAWLIAERRPADRAARIAKFWAAEAGARVAATSQHVHGGIGIDITYPLHRYFLWAKQNELTLGSASQQLAHLGSTYPEGRL